MGASITGLRTGFRYYLRRGYLYRVRVTTVAVVAAAGAAVLVHGCLCSRSYWAVTRSGYPSRARALPTGWVPGGVDHRLMPAHRERPCPFPSKPGRHYLNTVNAPQTTGSVPSVKEKNQLRKYMLCNIVYAPSFSCLQDGHALVYILHFPSRIRDATRPLCAPYTQ